MSYYCEIETADMLGDIFWTSGCQRQADLAAEVVFVCDDTGWIWRLIELYYPQATQIVDWFHAEERLEKVDQEALSGERAQEWLERVRTCLWEGDISFLPTLPLSTVPGQLHILKKQPKRQPVSATTPSAWLMTYIADQDT